MIDIRRAREERESLQGALARRGSTPDFKPILERDTNRRALITELQAHRSRQKDLSKQIGDLKKEGRDAELLMAQVRGMGDQIASLEKRAREEEEAIREMMLDIPNTPHPSVPDGQDEGSNKEIRQWGTPRKFSFQPRDHLAISESLGIVDLSRAAKITGARFPLMMGAGASLGRALQNFMLDLHTRRHDYHEVLPPFLVNTESAMGTGQLPKFEEDLFKTEGHEFYLTPTAEVPLTNIHRDEILSERLLPIKYTASTPCFRREAGSYGKETRGLIRQHQFDKVELVKFTSAETSYDELETLTADAEEVLQRLEIPYRVVILCAGDLGFSAAKTYDIEVWLPAKQGYLEVSSCSNYEDFQAHRIGVRYRTKEGKTSFAHTLNGSGLAIGRTIVSILENFQQGDGSVEIPMALRPYMGGMETITRVRTPWNTKGGDQQPSASVPEGTDKKTEDKKATDRQGGDRGGQGQPAPARPRNRRSRNRKGRGGQRGDRQGQNDSRETGGPSERNRHPGGGQAQIRETQDQRPGSEKRESKPEAKSGLGKEGSSNLEEETHRVDNPPLGH